MHVLDRGQQWIVVASYRDDLGGKINSTIAGKPGGMHGEDRQSTRRPAVGLMRRIENVLAAGVVMHDEARVDVEVDVL